mmetsp:Transcript_17021/g.34609  ORF Transcript_17021/g.34609 Transcript_17021/m.34609 type:complete len:251 (-) Transcript_17021:152-904(-)
MHSKQRKTMDGGVAPTTKALPCPCLLFLPNQLDRRPLLAPRPPPPLPRLSSRPQRLCPSRLPLPAPLQAVTARAAVCDPLLLLLPLRPRLPLADPKKTFAPHLLPRRQQLLMLPTPRLPPRQQKQLQQEQRRCLSSRLYRRRCSGGRETSLRSLLLRLLLPCRIWGLLEVPATPLRTPVKKTRRQRPCLPLLQDIPPRMLVLIPVILALTPAAAAKTAMAQAEVATALVAVTVVVAMPCCLCGAGTAAPS